MSSHPGEIADRTGPPARWEPVPRVGSVPSSMPSRPSRRVPSPVVLVLVTSVLVVVVAWAAAALTEHDDQATCRDTPRDLHLTAPSDIGTIPLDRTQVANADTVVRTTMATGRTPQAATVALATAMQESALLNLDHGDEAGPDSRGLFQQRLQFYGDVDVMDPAAATRAFLDRLDTVPHWTSMPPADAIQTVQRAAYPERYADWIGPAGTWADALWTYAESCAGSTA